MRKTIIVGLVIAVSLLSACSDGSKTNSKTNFEYRDKGFGAADFPHPGMPAKSTKNHKVNV